MKINDLFKNTNGEVVEVIEVDEVRKTCMIEFENGRTKSLSFSTLKDKRRWTPIDTKKEELKIAAYEAETDYVAEIMQQKKDLGIECPEIDLEQVVVEEVSCTVDEDICGDGTPLAEVGKEIAEQVKEKAKKSSKKNLIEYNGKAFTLHGWSKELGVPFGTLYARITRFNWTYEEALSGVKNK